MAPKNKILPGFVNFGTQLYILPFCSVQHSKWFLLQDTFTQLHTHIERAPLSMCKCFLTFSHALQWRHQEQLGTQYLAQRHFSMQTGEVRDQSANLPTGRLEHQPPTALHCKKIITVINFTCQWFQWSG